LSNAAVISMKQASKAHERMLIRWEEDLPQCMKAAFDNDDVTEVMIENTRIMTDCYHSGIQQVGSLSESEAEALANVIVSIMGGSLTKDTPKFEGELPFNGYRVGIVTPPITTHTTITIRKHSAQIFSLSDYLTAGSLTFEQKATIERWILDRKNILVVGGTASGKTTFINSLIAKIVELNPEHRLIILEDTIELQCCAYSFVQMRSTDSVTLQDLVKTSLRHRPDRIIVGEVRGKEAFDLLTAWSTGRDCRK
jgi:Flp pilus assembly CpaF family ATPase